MAIQSSERRLEESVPLPVAPYNPGRHQYHLPKDGWSTLSKSRFAARTTLATFTGTQHNAHHKASNRGRCSVLSDGDCLFMWHYGTRKWLFEHQEHDALLR
jgi:hypothetical protein